ncbi:MAG: NAD-dependent DNA ligase LigA, partial [Bacteroidales bacterium]
MPSNPYFKTPFPEFAETGAMSEEEAGREVRQLREAIEHHDYLYYIRNRPQISDHQYDRLFRRLQDLEEAFPGLRSDVSPTRKVGAPPVDALQKRKHTETMLSLDSSDEEKDVKAFLKRMEKEAGGEVSFVTEPKFDGLSVEIVYEHGAFSYGATRGDGVTGEDVSENVKTIRSLPLQLRKDNQVPEMLSVRGEILLGKENFQKLNKQRIERGEDPFANARNAAAGMIRQLDSKKVADKPLEIFFYEIISQTGEGFGTHLEMLEHLPEWGLRTYEEYSECRSFEEIVGNFRELNEKREELAFEIDGLVIKMNDRRLREKIGIRQRSPRWAFAWKFQPKKEITQLVDIIVQVGRTGILTPVALLEPVEVGGVTVSRATLHNEEEVKKKDVRPGDTVRVQRAGDVIPEISERVDQHGKKRGKPFRMPEHCPVCNTEVVREGAYVLCPAGLSCEAQLKGRLIHFASRQGMNIEHLGERIIEQMIRREWIRNIPDLYRLDREKLAGLEGFAERSAQRLHDSIRRSKSVSLDRFLYAIGIRNVGAHLARVLAGRFGSLDRIRGTSYEELLEVDEVGPEIAESITHFFESNENQQMLDELEELGLEIGYEKRAGSEKLSGKVFVLTGELEGYTREEAKERIESL